ncbi:hypothetical protein M378DRAFT_158050 [Amanita muscaria Koide BX008]|uniref:Uncharacterized protein n=1 Tax=Amanita muscaria (strain Koide BX008) TaxID=946122 RepID=A0A0C2XIV3_AMAMK|nr:hypothetical protein M378DRAFT_158050 [Amanita muscaria Koide BX008]
MFYANAWPDVLGSLLDYLAERLPSPVYYMLLGILSRALVFLSSSLSFIASLLSSNPSDWNLHDIIPPLVTILCAYLALVTLYRTTTWAIRTFFWFIKWGLILGLIFTVVGWHLRGTDQNWGAVADIGDTIVRTALESANAHTREAAVGMDGGIGANSWTRRKRSSKAGRPRAWDSFKSHQRWQEHSQQDATNEMKSMVDMAGGILHRGGQWWMAAKSIIGEEQQGERAAEQDFKGKTKSRSR